MHVHPMYECGMSDDQPKATAMSAPEVATYNAAACQVRATAWVLQILVGDAVPIANGHAEVFRIAVGLPWPLAKIVHRAIGAAIEEFEKREGAIAVPNSVQKAFDQQFVARLGGSKPAAE